MDRFLEEDAWVLFRTEPGERFLTLFLFFRHHGRLSAKFRLPTRNSRRPATIPDFFATYRCAIERSGPDKPWFLKDATVIQSFAEIPRNPDRFLTASSILRFYNSNLPHIESFEEHWDLLLKAFNALHDGKFPDSIYLKLIFAALRMEGYPVKEDWLHSLGKRGEFVRQILFADWSPRSPEDARHLKEYFHNLLRWIEGETPWKIPNTG